VLYFIHEESTELGIGKHYTIAYGGSGTGFFTHMLNKLGCRILAVESNVEMIKRMQEILLDINIKMIIAKSKNYRYRVFFTNVTVKLNKLRWRLFKWVNYLNLEPSFNSNVI